MAGFRELDGNLARAAAGLVPALFEGTAAALHVFAAVSLEEILGQLLTEFAAIEPQLRVRTVFGASDELADHLLAGACGHVFLTADPGQFDRLGSAGLLLPGEAVSLAENGLAVVAKPDKVCHARRLADLARNDSGRVVLAGPDCPLGRFTKAYRTDQGLYELVACRAVCVEYSRAVLTAVRAGQGDLGVVYSSDAARAAWCRTLFRVRRASIPIRYSGTIINRGGNAAPARRLLTFVTSAQASRRFRQCGFLPTRARA
jgi:molybdate transport system substrate-binding protein